MKGYDGAHLILLCEAVAGFVLLVAYIIKVLWVKHLDKEISDNCFNK